MHPASRPRPTLPDASHSDENNKTPASKHLPRPHILKIQLTYLVPRLISALYSRSLWKQDAFAAVLILKHSQRTP
jgi:hypothetical protein